MVTSAPAHGLGSFLHEFRFLLGLGRQTWRLVTRRHKFALGIAALLMAVASACNIAVPLLLGRVVDTIDQGLRQGLGQNVLYRATGFLLLLIAAAYTLREVIGVLRRYLVENACTKIEKAVTVRVVNQLIRAELTTLSQEKIGALQGRI